MCFLNVSIFSELQINFAEADYSFEEGGDSMVTIRIQFRNTQNSFMLILNPVSIREAQDIFKVEQFIDTSGSEAALATSGEPVK